MNKQIRYFLVANILIGWGVFYTKVVLDEKFRVNLHLPFELCNLMQMIILYVVITNKAKLLDKRMYPSDLVRLQRLFILLGLRMMVHFTWFIFYIITLHLFSSAFTV